MNYAGEGRAAISTASPAVNSTYNAMLIIVVGWSILLDMLLITL